MLSVSSFAILTLHLVQLPFPIKLHEMLEGMADNGSQDVVSWQPHGRSFRVHQPEVFARDIMPYYFKQTKYKSFQRQLHIYGFHRCNKGMDKGAYFHSLFIQSKKSMSMQMVREKVKGTTGKKNKHEIEAPNFYKDMVVMENHPACYNNCNETKRKYTTKTKPVPIMMTDFSGMARTKNIDRSYGGRVLDPSSSSLEKNNFPLSTGNIASVVGKESIEDGEEAFFQGKKFHFVETSLPILADDNFLAFVTARGHNPYMPKCGLQ
jgi:hypothetical protein